MDIDGEGQPDLIFEHDDELLLKWNGCGCCSETKRIKIQDPRVPQLLDDAIANLLAEIGRLQKLRNRE